MLQPMINMVNDYVVLCVRNDVQNHSLCSVHRIFFLPFAYDEECRLSFVHKTNLFISMK